VEEKQRLVAFHLDSSEAWLDQADAVKSCGAWETAGETRALRRAEEKIRWRAVMADFDEVSLVTLDEAVVASFEKCRIILKNYW